MVGLQNCSKTTQLGDKSRNNASRNSGSTQTARFVPVDNTKVRALMAPAELSGESSPPTKKFRCRC